MKSKKNNEEQKSKVKNMNQTLAAWDINGIMYA